MQPYIFESRYRSTSTAISCRRCFPSLFTGIADFEFLARGEGARNSEKVEYCTVLVCYM